MGKGSGCSIGLGTLLTIIFVVLKLCGVIDWDWIWVFLPFIISFVIVVIMLIALIVVYKRLQ